jgi:DNA-directed RNA polymerase subunit A'
MGLKVIKEIKFGILSPDSVRQASVAKIITADTYDDDGYPIEHGLMDPKLGVIDPGLKCRTCGQRFGECHGHFGHVDLARPVVHVGYSKDVFDILKAICSHCYRILLAPEEIEEFKRKLTEPGLREVTRNMIYDDILKKAARIRTFKKNNKCPYCGTEQPKIKFEKPTTYFEEKDKLTPSDIRSRFEKITPDDAYLLSFDYSVSKPEWMVLTALPVPPVTVRPSITLESAARSEDDMTHKLVDIIRINQRLMENIDAGAPQLIVEDLWELLQYHVTTYFDNEVSGIPPARHRSGRVLKTLTQRLKGKEGRFRNNLSGKRVDFSARTVISPDPNLSINEVGVPYFVARELTVPEKVAPFNIERLRKLVLNGPHKFPGANYIITKDGKRKKITDITRDVLAGELEAGFTVERHLRNGDIVLFNRQPSLHRLSIMAHEVKVMPYKTFRLNLCVCPPYNADFDGDEMNLHVPQTPEAQAEARMIMLVQDQIISPRFGEPVIGGVQDYITGAFLLTKKGTTFMREEVIQMMYVADIRRSLPELKKGAFTGKQVFSLLLPTNLNLEYKSKICEKCATCEMAKCKNDAYVKIVNGQLMTGVIDGLAFKARSECKLLNKLVKDYGTTTARRFLDSATKLILWMLNHKGITTAIDDISLPPKAQERIEEVLSEGEEKVQELVMAYENDELETLPGRTLEETLENKIMQVLAMARDKAGKIAEEYLGIERFAVIMAKTGAKGNMLDLTQMTTCLGQMSVRGRRLHRGYAGRSLSHFEPKDLRAKARGFVHSSYKRGLTPTEFFFHAMGGREGLVDTAVRTAQSGYMQRRLMNAMQDLKVDYDRSVRGNDGIVVQFRYGEDGVDPAKSNYGEAVDIDWIIHKTLVHRGE